MACEIIHGDCLEVMRGMADNSVDAIVTDPPYGLVGASRGGSSQPGDLATPYGRSGPSKKRGGFMGKEWDASIPGAEYWSEALRIAKPGAYILAFGGTRTFHRLAVAIEDAGWEIRDTLMWVYGSGFPKSRNVCLDMDKMDGHGNRGHRIAVANRHHPDGTLEPNGEHLPAYEPKTDAAKQWAGWGTALKPAWEPIIMARKPLVGTVAANVMEHGTGALNIDGCRVEADLANDPSMRGVGYGFTNDGFPGDGGAVKFHEQSKEWRPTQGRWPANLIHDGSDEVVGCFPHTKSPAPYVRSTDDPTEYVGLAGTIRKAGDVVPGFGDTGSAARFFYCAKASKADRDEGLHACEEKEVQINMVQNRPCANCGGWSPYLAKYRPQSCCQCGDYDPIEHRKTTSKNHHPTVKPTALMRYLCRLVTPPGGTVLDPFTGSGSTGKAAKLEGFNFIGIEREAEYVAIAEARIAEAQRSLGLFA